MSHLAQTPSEDSDDMVSSDVPSSSTCGGLWAIFFVFLSAFFGTPLTTVFFCFFKFTGFSVDSSAPLLPGKHLCLRVKETTHGQTDPINTNQPFLADLGRGMAAGAATTYSIKVNINFNRRTHFLRQTYKPRKLSRYLDARLLLWLTHLQITGKISLQ